MLSVESIFVISINNVLAGASESYVILCRTDNKKTWKADANSGDVSTVFHWQTYDYHTSAVAESGTTDTIKKYEHEKNNNIGHRQYIKKKIFEKYGRS